MEKLRFYELFKEKKPIIGMIHLAGHSREDKHQRALEELAIFDEYKVDGAIIENYHGDVQDVYDLLKHTQHDYNLIKGVNILGRPELGFQFAREFGAKFVQFDSVQSTDIIIEEYNQERDLYRDILVLGGVRFKYTTPTGLPLKQDLYETIPRVDAIVTTGAGTGKETPLQKLKSFKELMNGFPLVVGAGVTLNNLEDQLKVADGAIIGSYFKPHGNTELKIDKIRVREIMDLVFKIRENI